MAQTKRYKSLAVSLHHIALPRSGVIRKANYDGWLLCLGVAVTSKRENKSSRAQEILLEVRPNSLSGDLGPSLLAPEQFRSRADEIADSIAEIADQFRNRFEKALKKSTRSGWRMNSIELTFHISVEAEAGVIIARAASSATFSAKLTLEAPVEPE